MDILYGKPVAEKILIEIKKKIEVLDEKPKLGVILVGSDPASRLYVDLKRKRAQEIGMDFELSAFLETSAEGEILQKISQLNQDLNVNGIIVQLPLPVKFDTQKIINAILPEKDVDGFHPQNVEEFSRGESIFEPVFPQAIASLLKSSKQNLVGKKAAILANSKKFFQTMEIVLKKEGIDSFYVNSKELEKSAGQIKMAEIVITAIGKPKVVSADLIKNGALVIDGGISKENEKVVGDVDLEGLSEKAIFISPVPGGVGPLTIACLLNNVYRAFCVQNNLPK